MESATTEVRRNAERSRYELFVDGRMVGFAEYVEQDGSLVFPHTEINASMRGRGLGADLVRGALDDVRARGITKIVPHCWFVADFLAANEEYADLAA